MDYIFYDPFFGQKPFRKRYVGRHCKEWVLLYSDRVKIVAWKRPFGHYDSLTLLKLTRALHFKSYGSHLYLIRPRHFPFPGKALSGHSSLLTVFLALSSDELRIIKIIDLHRSLNLGESLRCGLAGNLTAFFKDIVDGGNVLFKLMSALTYRL